MPLVLLERSWRSGFNGIYLVRFGLRIRRILIFKWFFAAENSNKFQKTRFCKEKSVENMVKLEGLPFNSSMISLDIWRFKKSIHTLQNNVHMFSLAYFVMGSHLGVKGTCHTSLCMKEGSLFVLFCFVLFYLVRNYEIHQTQMLQIALLVSLESSWWGGLHWLCSMTFGLAMQKFLNIEWFLCWRIN